jgi:HSP20 family molecular chaperone IbpA
MKKKNDMEQLLNDFLGIDVNIDPNPVFSDLKSTLDEVATKASKKASKLFDDVKTSADMSDGVSILEFEDKVTIEIELAGYKKDEIEVESNPTSDPSRPEISVKTTKEWVDVDNEVRSGRLRKNVSKTIKLVGELDVDSIAGEYTDGLLEITIPRKAEKKAVKIDIK